MYRLFIICQLIWLVNAKHISEFRRDTSLNKLTLLAIIQDINDPIVTPIVQALNISLTYYKDVYKIKEKVDMGVVMIDANNSQIGLCYKKIKTFYIIDDEILKSDFLISLATDKDVKQQIMTASHNLNIPTIQTQLSPWEGFYKGKVERPYLYIIFNYSRRSDDSYGQLRRDGSISRSI
jgi:hypothetical protein